MASSHHDKGVNPKKSTRLVNDTHVKLHLYYVSSNGNPYFRKTLYPRPSNNNDASVDVSTETGVTTVNDGEELKDGHTFIEEFDSNNTFGLLRLWDEKRPVVALDTDQLIDNREITITISDGNFMPKFTARLWMRNFPWSFLTWIDELIDSQEITITISDYCNFTPKFEGRSQEKQPKATEYFPGESSARPESIPSGNSNFLDKVKQYSSKFRSFRLTKPNRG